MIVLNGAEEEEDDDVGDDDVEEEDRSEDLGLGPQFLRACAVEMHFNISKEPLCTESCTKMPHPRLSPKRRHTLCASLRNRMHFTFHKSQFLQKFTGKMPRLRLSPECRRTLCASLRSQNALQHFTRATLYGNLQEKCRAPNPWTTLCANLRSRNALQHLREK